MHLCKFRLKQAGVANHLCTVQIRTKINEMEGFSNKSGKSTINLLSIKRHITSYWVTNGAC